MTKNYTSKKYINQDKKQSYNIEKQSQTLTLSDNRENNRLQAKLINEIKNNAVQRAPCYIPGQPGPLASIDDSGQEIGVYDFEKSQRKRILSTVGGDNVNVVVNGKAIPNHANGQINPIVEPKIAKTIEAQIDHIVPQNKGGGNTNLNAQILDGKTNAAKKDTYPANYSSFESGCCIYIPERRVFHQTSHDPDDSIILAEDYTVLKNGNTVSKFIIENGGYEAPEGTELHINLILEEGTKVDLLTAQNLGIAPPYVLPD